MKLKLWQVDAFASRVLEGNPAAVVPLDAWLDAGLMQKIANENNLAETAFFVKTAPGRYDLRWFTPESKSIFAAMRRSPAPIPCSNSSTRKRRRYRSRRARAN